MLVLVLVLVFTWGLRPSNWVPKSVSVTSEAAQQPPARAHFVKQTEERRGGTLIIALPILTLTMLHCTTQHYLHGYLLSTLFTETRASAAENEETGTGEEIGRCYLRQIFSKEENISRLFTTDGQFTSFQSGRLVWPRNNSGIEWEKRGNEKNCWKNWILKITDVNKEAA